MGNEERQSPCKEDPVRQGYRYQELSKICVMFGVKSDCKECLALIQPVFINGYVGFAGYTDGNFFNDK
jgi:hypothetical protein